MHHIPASWHSRDRPGTSAPGQRRWLPCGSGRSLRHEDCPVVEIEWAWSRLRSGCRSLTREYPSFGPEDRDGDNRSNWHAWLVEFRCRIARWASFMKFFRWSLVGRSESVVEALLATPDLQHR